MQRQRGVTLVELIVAIVIISVGLAGILSAFNVSVKGSADPVMNKQLVSVAEALLEEVQQAAFTYCDPDDANAETAVSAAGCATLPEVMGPEAGDARPFDNVNDYNGLLMAAITDVAGVAVPNLAGYSASIAVAPVALNTITLASGDALRITVTVTAPSAQVFTLDGYRTRYAPNALP
ncbi:MAG: type II secretion system protein [Betaproteobacteria bacterium]